MNAAAPHDPDRALEWSVLLCTHNGARRLAGALDALVAQQPPPRDWEVLVVANACTDDTVTVAGAFADRLPLRVVTEPRLGIAHARNRAVRAARGAWLAWLDDDVRPGPGWLAAYARAREAHPHAGLLGGPILARFEPPAPAWTARHLDALSAAFCHKPAVAPDGVLRASKVLLPNGANFAVRADLLPPAPFDTALGHFGARRSRLGEDHALMQTLLARGGTGRWVDDAVSEHLIPAERQTAAYLRRFYYAQGWRSSSGRASRRLLARAVRAQARALWQRLRRNDDWVLATRDAARYWGMLACRLRERFRSPP